MSRKMSSGADFYADFFQTDTMWVIFVPERECRIKKIVKINEHLYCISVKPMHQPTVRGTETATYASQRNSTSPEISATQRIWIEDQSWPSVADTSPLSSSNPQQRRGMETRGDTKHGARGGGNGDRRPLRRPLSSIKRDVTRLHERERDLTSWKLPVFQELDKWEDPRNLGRSRCVELYIYGTASTSSALSRLEIQLLIYM